MQSHRISVSSSLSSSSSAETKGLLSLFWGFILALRNIICQTRGQVSGIKKAVLYAALTAMGFANQKKMIASILASTKIICNPLSFNERDILEGLAVVGLLKEGKKTSTVANAPRTAAAADEESLYDAFFGSINALPKHERKSSNDAVSVDVIHRKPNIGYAARRSVATAAEKAINEHVDNDWVKIGLGAFTSVIMGLSVNGTGRIIDWKEVARIGTQDPAKVKITFPSFKRGSVYEKWAKEYMERWREAHPEFKKPKSGWRERKALLYKELKDKMSLVHTIAERRKLANVPLYKQIVPAMYKILEGRVKPSDFITVKYSPTVSIMILGFYSLFMREEIQRAFATQTLESTARSLQNGGSIGDINSAKLYELACLVRRNKELRHIYVEYVKYIVLEMDAVMHS